ncbi:CBL-interacting serine/threonine-protein kinase 1-like protein [Tanacetum coccineum]
MTLPYHDPEPLKTLSYRDPEQAKTLPYRDPDILSNRGYDGAALDTWSCDVILYVILTGYLPFDDRNLGVLYEKIFKGDVQMPKWMSPGPKSLLNRILDPNPKTRITIKDIKADEWFKQDYTPTNAKSDLSEEDDIHITNSGVLSIEEDTSMAEALDNKFKTKVSIKWGRMNFECYISNMFQLSPLLRFNCARKILGSFE